MTGVSEPSRKQPKTKTARRKLYDLHAWVGFHLAFVMGLILLTGTLATLAYEIDWMVQDDMRVTPGDSEVSWAEMVDAVQEAYPHGTIAGISDLGNDYIAHRAIVVDPGGGQNLVHVNQWTGEVTGETHPLTVQRFLRNMHRYLFMPNYIGLPIVTSFSIVLIISLYTGLKTARNWGTLMTRLRRDKGARIFWGDAHKAAGLWAMWFVALMAITGLWYLAEYGVSMADGQFDTERPVMTAERVEQLGPVIEHRSTAELVAFAQEAFPQQRISGLEFPLTANGPVTVLGWQNNPLLRERANRVFLDPNDGSVLKLEREEDLALIPYLNEYADPLHFGNFGGIWSKLVWFIFGMFLTCLSFTGVWLTWKRLRSSAVTPAQFLTLPVLVAAVCFFPSWAEKQVGPSDMSGEDLLAETHGGEGIDIALVSKGDEARLALSARAGRPNLKSAKLLVDGEEIPLRPRMILHHMSMPVPLGTAELQGATRIEAHLEFNDSSTAQALLVCKAVCEEEKS